MVHMQLYRLSTEIAVDAVSKLIIIAQETAVTYAQIHTTTKSWMNNSQMAKSMKTWWLDKWRGFCLSSRPLPQS